MLRKVIIKDTLFCYLFNPCVKGDLVEPSDALTVMLNQKWLFVMEQFTVKRWLVLDKLLTKSSQNILHNEAAAVSATHSQCHIFFMVCSVKQHGFSKFKLSHSGQCCGWSWFLKIKNIKVSYERKWSIWQESAKQNQYFVSRNWVVHLLTAKISLILATHLSDTVK